MADHGPLTSLLQRHRAGDADATRRLFEHYAQRLCRLARQHLSVRVQPRADGEDVVQSVFRTFFLRDSQGQFEIRDSLQLWQLLVTITLRKARKTWRQHTAEMRDTRRETALPDREEDWLFSCLARGPSAVEAIVLADEINSLLDGLSADHARLLELRLAGSTVSEAAAEMGISRQAVHRLLHTLQQRLECSVTTME